MQGGWDPNRRTQPGGVGARPPGLQGGRRAARQVGEGRLGCDLERGLESNTRVMEAPGKAGGKGTGRGYSRAGRLLPNERAAVRSINTKAIRRGGLERGAGRQGAARALQGAELHSLLVLLCAWLAALHAGGTTTELWLLGGGASCARRHTLIRSWRPEQPALQGQRPRGQPGPPWRLAGRCPKWPSGLAA